MTEPGGPGPSERNIVGWYDVPRVPVAGEWLVVLDSNGAKVNAEVIDVIFEATREHEMGATVRVRRHRD